MGPSYYVPHSNCRPNFLAHIDVLHLIKTASFGFVTQVVYLQPIYIQPMPVIFVYCWIRHLLNQSWKQFAQIPPRILDKQNVVKEKNYKTFTFVLSSFLNII